MIVPALVVGGMEMLVVDLAIALTRRGRDVGITCISGEGPLAERARDGGVEVALQRVDGPLQVVLPLGLVRRLRHLRPDVVGIHSGAWLKGARAAKVAGVPRIVHTMHGRPEERHWHDGLVSRCAGRWTSRIVVVSEELRHYAVHDLRLPDAKLDVILNGVNTVRFRPGQSSGVLRGQLGLGPDARLIGAVGRLDPVKDHATLLRAMVLVRAAVPAAHLAIVGDGALRGHLEQLAGSLGVGDAVSFCGLSADTAQVYRDIDLFVLSSLREGTSMSLLEAASSGVPCVATDVGGTPIVLDGGRGGSLVMPGDARMLADAVIAALSDTSSAMSRARHARATIELRFSEDAMVDGYLRTYLEEAGTTHVESGVQARGGPAADGAGRGTE